ncbi:hypothetical protein RO3G_15223 [Rhizopus delemar RA 99-880]|uniref:MARVEL domain-containing protein n=1 Tax=Rhizopus delemar (strain RA 99-880 / ATCC MYA-4621 / FGSC 9543 / NRRL 43880) TaxID=246409 RepID=I1CPY2_RHIO9|nr:hypothetical protein RO3G_15223 [Rhizopus delemar RA 99-880]|eukprot:EIE90512.1 hypothetical protein RO3G_15223 [Rhizopus delemar RA 99-880]
MISRKESIFHIALLIIVQLSSLLVVSINGTLICKVKQSDLFNEESNLDHFSLLLLAIFSFVASSSLLLSHVELWPKTLPSPASYTFLAVELMISITLIALFAMITTPNRALPTKSYLVAFITACSWVLVLLSTFITLIYSTLSSEIMFDMETSSSENGRLSYPRLENDSIQPYYPAHVNTKISSVPKYEPFCYSK